MSTIVLDSAVVHIPESIPDLESFRRWVHSDQFPEQGRISYLNGEVWLDMSKEQFYHNQAKGEYAIVLGGLVKKKGTGRYLHDGMLLTNSEADLSTNPDGIFVSTVSFQARKVVLVEGSEQGYVELQGTPDMVLEVISPGSVDKDTEILRDLYWQAGIIEYWLVDAQGDGAEFDILRHAARGYTAVRKQGGWVKSIVFGQLFKLTRKLDPLGFPEFRLAMK